MRSTRPQIPPPWKTLVVLEARAAQDRAVVEQVHGRGPELARPAVHLAPLHVDEVRELRGERRDERVTGEGSGAREPQAARLVGRLGGWTDVLEGDEQEAAGEHG
jgi:hypothetical protein